MASKLAPYAVLADHTALEFMAAPIPTVRDHGPTEADLRGRFLSVDVLSFSPPACGPVPPACALVSGSDNGLSWIGRHDGAGEDHYVERTLVDVLDRPDLVGAGKKSVGLSDDRAP